MGGGEADIGVLEGDAAPGRHAQPPRRLEVDIGVRLAALDVVARGDRLEVAEEPRAAEMALHPPNAPRGGDAQRRAAASQGIEDLGRPPLDQNVADEQAAPTL